MDKKTFVSECGKLLSIAKPHLISCELLDEDTVLITCRNGHTYTLNIAGNSLNAIATDIFSAMANK